MGELRFTQSELQLVPYFENDNLVFKDSLSDSIFFPNITRSSYYNWRKYLSYSEEEQKECGDYYEAEQASISSYSNYVYYSLNIYLYFVVENDLQIRKYISIEMNIHHPNDYQFFGKYPFDDIVNYQDSKNSNISFYDSLSIDSIDFYSVYRFKPTFMQNVKQIDSLYYTLNDGIIGFKMEDGKIWHKTN